MTIGGIFRIVVPQIAVAIGSNIYDGRANTTVAALIIGTLGAFLSYKGYLQRAEAAKLSSGPHDGDHKPPPVHAVAAACSRCRS